MEDQQKSTTDPAPQVTDKQLEDYRYDELISYKALNGLVTDVDGGMRRMSMQELANALGVDRTTLYLWMKRDGFWEAVNERRREVSPKSRLSKVHEVWFLSALKPGNEGFRDRQLYLANFDPKFRMPTEKVQVEAGDSWLALYEGKKDIYDAEVIEGEIVDNAESTN